MDAPPHGPRGPWMAAVSFPEAGNESEGRGTLPSVAQIQPDRRR